MLVAQGVQIAPHSVYVMYAYKCTLWYTWFMEVPITQFRREVFTLVNKALDGAEVWVSHKGRRLKLVPEGLPANRLSRITPMEIVNYAEGGLENTGLMDEMTRAWEADWERDFGPVPGSSVARKSATGRGRVKP